MWTEKLPKNRRRKYAQNSLSKFNLFLHMGIHEEFDVSREITDIRDILQYTMWLKQGSAQKATCVVLNKFISQQLMQKVISNGKMFKYENIFCQNLYKTLLCNSSQYEPC
jgi:hypothetical protein